MTNYKNNLWGLCTIVAACLALAACNKQETGNAQATGEAASSVSGKTLKVAYVEVDSLLAKYKFCIDLNEAMVKKQENVRVTLNQKAKELENARADFQKKYDNHAFVSQESAQQQYNALMKKEQDLQELSNKLQAGLLEETGKNNLQLRDSINVFLREYNKTHGYSLIFSNTGLDNLLYADEAFNITQEVVDGLNARYTPAKAEKAGK